jgi:hypothetical protein
MRAPANKFAAPPWILGENWASRSILCGCGGSRTRATGTEGEGTAGSGEGGAGEGEDHGAALVSGERRRRSIWVRSVGEGEEKVDCLVLAGTNAKSVWPLNGPLTMGLSLRGLPPRSYSFLFLPPIHWHCSRSFG